jgi:ABC-type branched-subunit amino acid transport system ATPase component
MKYKDMKQKKSFAAKLHSIENGISGVQNNLEIPGLMSQYGYTPERIAEGQVKLADVKQLTANVLVYLPKSVLLGEPLVGVDAENSGILRNHITYLNREKVTFIIVEHKRQLMYVIVNKVIKVNKYKN